MGRRPPDDDPERALLDEAMRDVRPLSGRSKLAPPPQSRRPVRPPRRAGDAPARFQIDSQGERLQGIAPGIDRGHLQRLRRGQVRAERELDLHGLRVAEARDAVAEALAAALAGDERCVRIVHGRGLHSRGGAVLRQQLADWLADPPHGARVMAFASTRDGGATYVLLRRQRRGALS